MKVEITEKVEAKITQNLNLSSIHNHSPAKITQNSNLSSIHNHSPAKIADFSDQNSKQFESNVNL